MPKRQTALINGLKRAFLGDEYCACHDALMSVLPKQLRSRVFLNIFPDKWQLVVGSGAEMSAVRFACPDLPQRLADLLGDRAPKKLTFSVSPAIAVAQSRYETKPDPVPDNPPPFIKPAWQYTMEEANATIAEFIEKMGGGVTDDSKPDSKPD